MLKKNHVIDIFEKELKNVEEKIKSEIYSSLSQEFNKINSVISAIISDINAIKNEMKENQKIAISSAIEGIAKINIKQFTENIKSEILDFLEKELQFPTSSEIEEIINDIITSKTIEYFNELRGLIIQNINQVDSLNKKLESLEKRIENLENKEVKIDTSDIKNEISILRSMIRDIVGKIEYIYNVNNLIEKRIKEKEETEGEEE